MVRATPGIRRGTGYRPDPPVPGASTLIVRTARPSTAASNGAHMSRFPPMPMSSSRGRPSPRTAIRSRTPSTSTCRTSGEGADTGDVPADDEGLDGFGAFVGVDGLDVGHVPDDVEVEQDAVAAE